MASPLERLRRIWAPGHEIEEVVHSLEPATELDSMIRDWLHRICEQNGAQTVVLGVGDALRPNTGVLRFEIVHHQPSPGAAGQREVTVWVEGSALDPPLIPGALEAAYSVVLSGG